MLTCQFCLNEKKWTNNNKAPHVYALLFQTLVVSSLGSCFLSALCSGPSSSALKWGSLPSVLPHTPARVIFPKYNLPKSLLCLKIFQWVNKLLGWKASLCPPDSFFTAPHPVLHTPPTLGGWPVWTASVVSPGPLAPGWLWPVVSTAEEWIEGGEKCICLPSSHFMRLLWAVILFLFFFSRFFFFKWWGPFLKSLLNLLQYCFCFMFWFSGCEACGILIPSPGIKPAFPCKGRWSLNHWTAREVPCNSWAKALVSINQPFTCNPCLPLPHLASTAQEDNVNCLTGCCISPKVSLYLVLIWVECV